VGRGLCLAFLAAASLWSSVTFTDSTFSPSDYSVITWKSDPSITISVGQTQNGGNPGQALQIMYSLPGGNGNSVVGLSRPSFTYNPATQGAIQSIDFSAEKYVTYTGCSSCYIDSNTARAIILQNGAYYMAVLAIPGNAGVYIRASATGLRASDFGLFDFNTGNLNTAINPNFNSGVMQFGLANRYLFTSTNSSQVDVRYDNLSVTVQSVPPPPTGPVIGGVVSASAFGGFSSVAPGSWVEIYGSNLTDHTRQWTGSDFIGNSAPTMLDGVGVTIGGQKAFVDFISSGQVNAQLPSNIGTGPTQITLTSGNMTSAPFNITVNTTQPGLLAPPSFKIGGNQYVVAQFSDGTYVLPAGSIAGVTSRPAKPGDTIVIYGVGFGSVTPNIPAGQIVTQANQLALPLQILFGQTSAQTPYFGLAPGFVGLFQFNVVVPGVANNDLAPLTFNLGGVAGTQTLYIAVRQ
jgi:uncharacterized protein (TIGR03437 family)